ncbi:GH116 family glycosyl-hydrolase [Formosa sp. PL04]|uniref:GH116 family glycosyl-hydrolase n=1 Tax=Formosa sp. PL04 TaxID=3081755 RepID=UPI0029816C4F|nr:GH116 family glycosyl-hydrolase [Formosa sp. PL04]MDW5288903.1 GH116 family glycosyl-hydrolase [Formosa sp. PL04]
MKKLIYSYVLLFCVSSFLNAQIKSIEWAVLKTYDQNHTDRIAMPIGGIGTGTISLRGYGALIDWEVMSRSAKGYNPLYAGVEVINRAPFFSIYIKEENKDAQALILEAPVPTRFDDGFYSSKAPNHGLPRFSESTFQKAYPFGQVLLKNKGLPVEITVGAFNPFIPGNAEDSSLPMAVLSYKVKNTSEKPITISLAGNIPNFIGFDSKEGKAYQNINAYKEENGLKRMHYTANKEIEKESTQWGTFSLVTNNDGEVSHRTALKPGEWGKSTLEFWDDYADDGLLQERISDQKNNMESLAVKTTLAPNKEKNIRFFVTWKFPNRPAWGNTKYNVGNYYATQNVDSWEVAQKNITRIKHEKTNLKD